MNYRTKVHVTGVIAIIEWENEQENKIESLTIRTMDNNMFGIYLCDENKPVMCFPGVGCGPVRLVDRMRRAEGLGFVTMYGAEYVEGVAGLINWARLEMLKRR